MYKQKLRRTIKPIRNPIKLQLKGPQKYFHFFIFIFFYSALKLKQEKERFNNSWYFPAAMMTFWVIPLPRLQLRCFWLASDLPTGCRGSPRREGFSSLGRKHIFINTNCKNIKHRPISLWHLVGEFHGIRSRNYFCKNQVSKRA